MTATIEALGLTKQYGKTKALDGLDLIAQRGQVTAVLGPNGAGKTTFVRMVATLLRADAGTLLVAGHDAHRNPAAVRRVIGLAGQFAAVEPAMTGRENLEMVASLFGQSRRAAKASAAAVLEQLSLTEAGDRLARTYSGGMRRRLDLGASLVGAPRLLLLDEPTTGLDPRSRIELWEAIRALLQSGTDVLLTTQYLDEADHLADQIVIIDHGRAVAAGTPAQLKQRIGGNVIEVHVRDSRDVATIAELLGRTRRRCRTDRPGHATGERTRRLQRRRTDDRTAVAPRDGRRARRHRDATAQPRRGVPHPHRKATRRRPRRHGRSRGLARKELLTHDNHCFGSRPKPGDSHPPPDRAGQEHCDRGASLAAALRAHTAADRALHGPDVAVLPDLPLHVRRRDPHRRDVLCRLPGPRVHRDRSPVHRHGDRGRDGRGSRAGIHRPPALTPDPTGCRAHGPSDGGHSVPRLEHRVHRGRCVRGRVQPPRLGDRRPGGVRTRDRVRVRVRVAVHHDGACSPATRKPPKAWE